MKRRLKVSARTWRMKEPFVISRGIQTSCEAVVVELCAGAATGRGEAVGVTYRGETQQSVIEDIERLRQPLEQGIGRNELLQLLPAGGARNAIDAALWDLEAKCSGVPAWVLSGVPRCNPVVSAVTIGIRSPAAFELAAKTLADHPWIKVKVDGADPLAAVEAVRRGAPRSKLIVDPNQSWTLGQLKSLGPALLRLKVDLLEQPLPCGGDEDIAAARGPIPICADESVETLADIPRLVGRYDFINIKLDKTGGLTAALQLAYAARAAGLRLMVGCMVGGSVAMAPAMVLAQLCEVVDLDGPLLQAEDWPGGIVYDKGLMSEPWPALWG